MKRTLSILGSTGSIGRQALEVAQACGHRVAALTVHRSVALAEEQARQLRCRMEQWVQRVEREFDNLRSQVEATVSHAADQLSKAGACLEQVTALLEERDARLQALSQSYTEGGGQADSAPQP